MNYDCKMASPKTQSAMHDGPACMVNVTATRHSPAAGQTGGHYAGLARAFRHYEYAVYVLIECVW